MPALIEISDVSKRYPRSETPALDGVNLTVAQGAILGLLGPNGAGKTTLLSILLGLTRKDSGQVRIAGFEIERGLAQIRRLCGLAPQELGFYPMLTVAENLHVYGAAGGLSGAKLKEQSALAVDTAQLQAQLHKRSDRLSGGLKRRLNLALSLLHSPKLLFLDEPTVGVDPQSRAFILEAIAKLRAERGLTVIYTSHYMDEVQQLCSHVAILDQGRVLAQGALQDLLTPQDRDLEALFLRLTHRRLRD